jgi:hypothetical protein
VPIACYESGLVLPRLRLLTGYSHCRQSVIAVTVYGLVCNWPAPGCTAKRSGWFNYGYVAGLTAQIGAYSSSFPVTIMQYLEVGHYSLTIQFLMSADLALLGWQTAKLCSRFCQQRLYSHFRMALGEAGLELGVAGQVLEAYCI